MRGIRKPSLLVGVREEVGVAVKFTEVLLNEVAKLSRLLLVKEVMEVEVVFHLASPFRAQQTISLVGREK